MARGRIPPSPSPRPTVDDSAFGKIQAESNPAAADRFGYTGREFDREIQLQYNRARYYDAAIGRWLGEDPLGFAAGDPNLYRHVKNGVTNLTDLSGLKQATIDGETEEIKASLASPTKASEPLIRRLGADENPAAAAKRTMQAMMTMWKIDIAAIEAARRGEG